MKVWVETLIQYLVTDKTYAERPNFEGAKFVMSPPLRDKRNQDILWNGLRDGLVSTLATDHAPFDFATQKRMGERDFTLIPNGIPSLEDRVKVLYTYGVKRGRLDLHRFVEVASTQAAKLFGLFPRKGTIQPGSDADLVVYDPNYRGTLSVKTQTMNVDYNPFEGLPIEGRPAWSPSAARWPSATASSSVKPAAANSSSASRTTFSPHPLAFSPFSATSRSNHFVVDALMVAWMAFKAD